MITEEQLAARDFIKDVTNRAELMGLGMAKYPTHEIKLILWALEALLRETSKK